MVKHLTTLCYMALVDRNRGMASAFPSARAPNSEGVGSQFFSSFVGRASLPALELTD
jgi:hypothetical protein